jgi:signal transduction histidine kinase
VTETTAEAADPVFGIAGLKDAFETFSRSAGALSSAYEALEARAARVDLELARVNAAQRTILESIPSGLVARDAAGRVSAMNGAARSILGLEGDRSLERAAALEDSTGRPLFAGPAPLVATTEERTLALPCDRHVVLLWTRAPLSGEGAAAGSLDVFSDVTEVRRLRAEVAARDRLAALGETAAALAHQVRNPLNGFQGFLALLLRELAPLPAASAARVYAGKALEGARELERVVGSFLAFARPESLDVGRVGLDVLARDVVRAVEAAGAPVDRVSIDVRPRRLWIEADPVRLKQVLVNLVENALAATPAPGLVVLRARRLPGRGRVALEVEDEGQGIDADLMPRLFQPFATKTPGGSGLGLAYVRKAVELHGGSVRATNLSTRGARFTIELPGAARETSKETVGS